MSSSSSSSWLNRLLFSIGFVISSAVISADSAVPLNREPDVVQPEVNYHDDDVGGGALGVAWTLLRYAASGQVPVLTVGRDTAARNPDDEQGTDVISVLRKRVDELDSNSFPPETPPQDPNSVASYRTGTDDDDIGTSWYDDRTDEYRSTVEKQQQLRGVQRLPQAIIIGVKKGGTRALLEFLRTHPDVRAPGPEIHFFDKNYHRGLDWYRSQMPATLPGQITVEKTPSYWITREVPARLFNMSRDVRLVVVVRDPLTRALSDYAQAVTKRPDLGPFDRLAFLPNASSSSAAAEGASTALVDASWGPIRIGLYARHLERWLARFPRRSIHFVSGERLVSDPAAELAGVQDFLGLKRVVTDKHFFFNATKGFPCLKKAEGSGGSPRCLGKTKGRPHPRVDEKVLRRLRDFYRPFNERFYQMSGIDFKWP